MKFLLQKIKNNYFDIHIFIALYKFDPETSGDDFILRDDPS